MSNGKTNPSPVLRPLRCDASLAVFGILFFTHSGNYKALRIYSEPSKCSQLFKMILSKQVPLDFWPDEMSNDRPLDLDKAPRVGGFEFPKLCRTKRRPSYDITTPNKGSFASACHALLALSTLGMVPFFETFFNTENQPEIGR